ncbi:NAD-dependent epimerase/dehydratase family protein [Enterococcus sp. AZ109]|uniref:NAD-dependent epimerase/dehydratase family protein n=1 Tax=Enterococcus sp. AZ109 TaxID=2774634 RepID=UPI003F1FFEA3
MLIQNSLYLSELEKINDAKNDWAKIDNHSFLIIGATGMIGSYMIDALMQRNISKKSNIKIYAMSRSKEKLESRFSEYLSSPCFHLVIGDIQESIRLDESIDYVLHGASNTHPRAYSTDPIGTILTSIKGTENVLEFAVKNIGARVIFLSTVEIYGENRGDVEKFDESYCGYIDCNTLRAGYPEGKRASESLCQAYIEKFGIDIVIPRVCRTFGPTMLLDDSKASSQFILNSVRNEDIVLKSQGEQYFSYAYVGDVVYALLFILSQGKSGEAYNIAIEEFDFRLKDLAKYLAAQSNVQVIFDLPDAEEEKGYSKANKAILDSHKLNQLGWKHLFELEKALNHTIEIIKDEVV